VDQVLADLKTPSLHLPAAVETALGLTVNRLVHVIAAMQSTVHSLEAALATEFDQHPLAPVLRSAPGLGPVLAARVLAEVGDDPDRFATAQALTARVHRYRTEHTRLGPLSIRQRTARAQQAPSRRVPLVGLLRASQVNRRPNALRPTPRRR